MAKEVKKKGRPSVFTPEVLRKIDEVAALDGSVAEMAHYAGIHVDSIYARMAENKDFSDRITSLRERPILKARQTLVKSLDQPQHAQWYLARKRKNEFADRTELTGAEGNPLPLQSINVIPITDNER